MKCEKLATREDGYQFPCGQCASCRINRKREWQARLLLEAAVSRFSAFVTFTLEVPDAKKEEYCTYLDKRVVQLFLKRLRKRVPENRIRYLVVGEYGEKYGRAHYHALLFSSLPLHSAVLRDAWAQGNIDIGDVQPESIDYVLAYCLKSSSELSREKLERWDRDRRNAHPEFRLFSQGLGKAALPNLCVPDRESGELILQREFRVLGKSWPIGRYFRDRHRGGSATAQHNAGQNDSVAERRETAIERMLYEELRSLPVGSAAYQEQRAKIAARKAEQLELLQRKAVRDYYRNLHGHMRKRNETF